MSGKSVVYLIIIIISLIIWIAAKVAAKKEGIVTIKVNATQLAEIVNNTFLQSAESVSVIEQIEDAIQGHALSAKQVDCETGPFIFYVSEVTGTQGVALHKNHRYAFVKNCNTKEVFEWEGFSIKELANALQPYLVNARMTLGTRGN